MEKKDKNVRKELSDEELPGYQHYPEDEDVYNQHQVVKDIDPETKSKKTSAEDVRNEKNFKEDVSGGDLDIPGAELDDDMEEIGSEDEENNHFSLGGDDKENLEEDQGD